MLVVQQLLLVSREYLTLIIFDNILIYLSSRLILSFNCLSLLSLAMAQNKGWKALVLPALLTGIFGYAIATVIGVSIAKVLPLLPTV